MNIPEWNQPNTKPLERDHIEILKMVMGYVDDAHLVNIDCCAIEQELQDIVDIIEGLGIRIENGSYRKGQKK